MILVSIVSLVILRFFLTDIQLDVHVPKLLRIHLGGRSHHDVLGVLVHGEGNDLPDAVLPGEEHDHPVHAVGDTRMGRRTLTESIVHGREFGLHVLLAETHQPERLDHDLRVMVPHRPGGELDAVADQVVLVGTDLQGILLL